MVCERHIPHELGFGQAVLPGRHPRRGNVLCLPARYMGDMRLAREPTNLGLEGAVLATQHPTCSKSKLDTSSSFSQRNKCSMQVGPVLYSRDSLPAEKQPLKPNGHIGHDAPC